MRVLVSAGGTGGGIYPALAVAGALGADSEVLWIGGEGGMEATLVPRAGIPFEAIPAAGLHGVSLTALPRNAIQLLRGWRQARRVIDRFEPDVLFFTGGYVGVPVALAGRRIPSVMYVPDLEPALALNWIGKTADIVTVNAEESRKYFPVGKRVEATGYPIRPELGGVDKAGARRFFNLPGDMPVVLFFGGSRGARSLNEALWRVLPALLEKANILHVTGRLDWPRVAAVQADLPVHLAEGYHPHAYLHEEMAQAFGAADLVVSRAGAATMGEYPHFALPSVLVPYPHAWRYQKTNADYLATRGAAVVLKDEDLNTGLKNLVIAILEDPDRRANMGKAAAALAQGDAAIRIAALIREAAQEGGSRG